MRIRATNGRHALSATCRALLTHGHSASPRGEATRELTGFALTVDDPTDMLCTHTHPEFMEDLAALEALHLISGDHYGERIGALTAHLESRRWDPRVSHYGVRLREQMPYVAEALQTDPDTRQATGIVWRPEDLRGGAASYLCATGVQFLLRGERLNMIVTMRSNDAWHGLPYNLFAFSQLQCTLANVLGVPAGQYAHVVGSMHLYERHWARADALGAATWGPSVHGIPGQDWWEAARHASGLLRGYAPIGVDTDWYVQTLSSTTKDDE